MIVPKKISHLPVVWELRKLVLYCLTVIKATFRFKNPAIVVDSIIYFHIWWKNYQRKNEPLKNDFPWITFKAEKFLKTILHKDMIVFEYGSGSSTLYFSRRVKQVFSIEHDLQWFEHLRQVISQKPITNVECRLFEPKIYEPNEKSEYLSRHVSYKNKQFESYVKSIDAFPDEYFDLIVVDGRARTYCIAHAKNKIKQGGYLVIDNSDRDYYFDGNDYLWNQSEWKAIHFQGLIPYSFEFSKTSVFEKLFFEN